jgi:putative peptidoglycan lipid II flippase
MVPEQALRGNSAPVDRSRCQVRLKHGRASARVEAMTSRAGTPPIARTGASNAVRASGNQPPLPRPTASSLGRSASIVGLAFVMSRALGLAREVILARQFGTSGEYDAYVSAFRVPDLLFLVVMAGAFGAAFIPVFAGFLTRGDDERAWRLASAVLSYSAVVMLALCLIAFVFARPIMNYLVAPGLEPEFSALATRTMRLLLLSPIFLGLGIAAKGILEAQDLFTLPAVAPVLYNLAIIAGAIALGPRWGVYGVALGVVAGAVLHLGVQIPGLIRTGLCFMPSLSRDVPGLTEVGRLLAPRILGLAAFQLNFIVINYLASGTGEGKVSALNYAWQVMMLPHGVLALSISTVVFPTMARSFELGDLQGVRTTFMRALEPLLFLILPASIGLFVFRTAIVQTVFQSGAFSGRSTHLVTDPLAFLALGLIWYAVVEVLTRVFYAMHDTVTPVAAGILIIGINIVLGRLLLDPLGHAGLGLALSASTAVEAAVLLWVLRRRIGRFPPEFASWFAKIALASAGMAAVAMLIRSPLEEATAPGEGPRLMQIALLGYAIALVSGTYFVAVHFLRVPEVSRGLAIASRQLQVLRRIQSN